MNQCYNFALRSIIRGSSKREPPEMLDDLSSSQSDDSFIRATGLCSIDNNNNINNKTTARRDRSGIPKYIGGDSIRSVYTLETSTTATLATIDASTTSPHDEESHVVIEEDDNTTWKCEESLDVRRQGSSEQDPGPQKKEQVVDGGLEGDPSKPSAECHWLWKIEAPVPQVPQHAPLERASLRLRDLSLDTITSRISDFLRVHSICSYYSKEEPGRIDCLTCQCLKFVIRLWKDDDEYIVEVQRRRGCSILMRNLRKCLHREILAGHRPCSNCCEMKLRQPSKGLEEKMCSDLVSHHNEDVETSRRRRVSLAQMACLDLMESDKVDEKRLGIECLVGMTDPKAESAKEIARTLIYSEGTMSFRLRHSFLDLLSAKLPPAEDAVLHRDVASLQAEGTTSFSDDESLFEVKPPQSTQIGDTHMLALTTLANCLDLVYALDEDYLSNEATAKLHLWTPFWCRVLQVLVCNLHKSAFHPVEAALSAKCIRILEHFEPERLSPFICDIAAPLLKTAHEYGKLHHQSLEKESKDLVLRYCQDDPANKKAQEYDAESVSSTSLSSDPSSTLHGKGSSR